MALRLVCLALAVLLLPLTAEASNVEDDLVVGIQSSKTTAIRPLEPLERDFMSIYDLMYDGLMVINDDYLPECALAESYSHTGKNWTFKLRSDLQFSDGSPVTANDVAATATWILNKANSDSTDKGYYMNLKYFVDSVTAKDDRTISVKASRSYYGLLYAMTFPILPAWALEMDNPPGTGAYMLESFVPGNTLQLVTNPNWWQTPPQVSTILFVMHQLPSQVIESYEYARVDTAFTRQIASAQYKSGTSSLALDYRTNQLECLLMNHASSVPTGSKNVREAIRYLINVDYIAQQIYNGMVERTNTPFVAGTWMYNDGIGSYFKQNPAKATALLDEDGWTDTNDDGILDRPNSKGESEKLELTLHVYEEPDNDVRLETANYIKDTLEQYGFSIIIDTVSYAEAVQKLTAGSFELCLASFAMDVCPDAGFMLISGNTGNYCRYRSSEMTDLCSELRQQLEQPDYQYTLYKIQEQFAKDCPFICFFYRSGTVLTRKMYTTVRDVRELELLRGIESFRE